ncbi:MAG: PDZ domain-containing protein [Chloroflexaceae bacterium]|nr:PDZ domain-containing protein [Chloroflexaceae bacterium]
MEHNLHTTAPLGQLSQQMADAVERISPSLVLVDGRRRQAASGLVYASDLVLTADHVLEREEDLTIQTHDKRTLPAQFIGRDTANDLAVLRVADLNLAAAPIATGPARVGQFILAVGRPSSNGPMASLGIVSSVGGPLRTRRGGTLEQYIQTDAIPYPGFSGGPLIDAEGQVIGVTTTGLMRGPTLAVPARIAWRIAGTLAQHGHIKRGYLGISSQPIDLPASQRGEWQQERGLLISRVEEGSPAEAGGLLIGDILVACNQQPVLDTDDLQALLTGDAVDSVVAISVLRGGALNTLSVRIGLRS